MDWHAEVLRLVQGNGAGFGYGVLPWQEVAALHHRLPPAAADELAATLLTMIDLDYRNPHSVPASDELLPLPAGMLPDDLLCLETAVYVCVELGRLAAGPRLRALLREPRFHAIYPHLRTLHYDLSDLLTRLPG